jgi:hypothetical protein
LVLGIVSLVGVFCYFGFLAGVPAIVLGFLSLGAIKRSGGALGGSGMAIGGIVTGALGTLLFLGQIALFVTMVVLGATSSKTAATPVPVPPPAVTAPTPGGGVGSSPRLGGAAVHVVDLKKSGGPLRSQLAEQWREAQPRGEIVLVQTTTSKPCIPCSEIALALHDESMVEALDGVRLVRVDIDAFGVAEVTGLRFERRSVPWFYLMDGTPRWTDAISGDEWDENVPENIAPVLDDFVHGRLTTRRAPRPGGTAL